MSQCPLVSVIITTFHREYDLLNRAIQSVKDQTYSGIEIILVDDNGEDSAFQKENSEKFNNDPDIRYLVNKVNSGAQYSRNIGILCATGDYLAFLDDDDYWVPEKIQKQMDEFFKDPSLGMIYCDGYIIRNGDTENLKDYQAFKEFGKDITYEMLLGRDYVGTTTQVLIKKEAIAKSGLFDIALPARQDYEMWIRIAQHSRVKGIDEHLFYHVIHDGEQISKSSKKKLAGYYLIYKKNYKAYKKHSASKCRLMLKMARCSFESKWRIRGVSYCIRAFFANPVLFFKKSF